MSWSQEAPQLLAALILRSRALRRLQALRPPLSDDSGREVRELLRLQRQDLVAGLGHLQRTGGALARGDQRRRLAPDSVEIADNADLNLQSILQCRHRGLPVRLRVVD